MEDHETPEARKQRIANLCSMVEADKKHWEYAFKRMRNWRRFARGLQWPGMTKGELSDSEREYVANITMRHLKQRTASVYARNPDFRFRKTKRLNTIYWDGTAASLMFAQQQLMADPNNIEATLILQEAMQSRANSQMLDKIGETATVLYKYFFREQIPPVKKMMKKQVLASFTDGTSYIKQTFQRATSLPPEIDRALADQMSQLAALERMTEDMAEGEIEPNSAEMEELKERITALENSEHIILREGLALDYPDGTSIIPDRNLTYLPGFVGCGHVTEEYCLTPEQIREVYGINVKENFTAYTDRGPERDSGANNDTDGRTTARVWEIWDRAANTVCTVCEGYDDYLEEPHEPLTYTERFWPWFVYAPNAIADDEDPFPPSDVELIQCQQMEINRSGESLREHRYASRPGWVTGSAVSDEDGAKLANRNAHDVVALEGMGPDEDIRKRFQPFPTNPIDPNLYNTTPAFTDILRSVGTQEANLGGTSGATATESSIAESSRQSVTSSAIDELDDLLTEMARAGGQILMLEMSPEKVKEIVGPGAVWPEQSREQTAKEVFLEVVAGSAGRPNQTQEVQIRERMYPLLFQLPGLSHEMLVKDALRVLDDGVDYEDWIDMTALPVVAMNGQMQAEANRGSMEGEGGGASNAPNPPEPGNAGPARPGQQGMGDPNM